MKGDRMWWWWGISVGVAVLSWGLGWMQGHEDGYRAGVKDEQSRAWHARVMKDRRNRRT